MKGGTVGWNGTVGSRILIEQIIKWMRSVLPLSNHLLVSLHTVQSNRHLHLVESRLLILWVENAVELRPASLLPQFSSAAE